ncbi:MAG: phage major capsid protein [Ruminococcus sp.]|nr:phage major capsid protein [Ruminococcus sp.]
MFKNEKALKERQNDLITRAETLVNTAENEKRELTDAEAQELAEIRDDVKKIKEMLEVQADIDSSRPVMEGAKKEEEIVDDRACGSEDERAIAINEERAFENFLRDRVVHERTGELAPANNGKIIPKTIARKIVELVYDISPILARSEKFNVKGTLEIPVYPADASTQIAVDYASEFDPLDSSTGNFTTVTLGNFLAGALTKVSVSLVNNVEFDIVGFVVKRMAYDIARWIEKEQINGTASKIEGLSGATNVLTVDSALEITGDDLITLQGMVKDVYQDGSIWIMNPKTRDAIRKIKDDVGRYLLVDDLSSPFGKSLLGKPVYVSDNANEITANKPVIYYGDMSGLSTKFSEEIHIQVLRELFATEHAIGVVGWVELDSKVTNNQKIAVLKMHSA